MTAAVARHATQDDHDLLGDYLAFCHLLKVSDRALRDRLRAARAFLASHADLAVWMQRPVQQRLTDLRRTDAWSLVGWAILAGRVAADLDLLLRKDFGSLGAAAEVLFPRDFADAHAVAGRLGWSPTWARSIVREALVLTIAATRRSMRELTRQDVEELRDQIDASPLTTEHARKRHKAQLFGLAQLLFEAGVLDTPPQRHYPAAATIDQRFATALPDTAIRAAMTRYVTARAAVLSPSSVDGLVNDLIPFGTFLAQHHPQVVSLRQLDRNHVEGFLACNRSRTWRGRKARDQQVSSSVVHAAVLSLRNFLDDITLWGWADRPTRQLLFATDVPKLPRALPRALAPHEDSQLVAAVNELEDPFARCGLLVLRYAGLRLGELLDLELDAVVDYGPAGTWLRVPLGKLKTERSVPLDAATVAALDDWITVRSHQRALPHPVTGKPTDFLFVDQGPPARALADPRRPRPRRRTGRAARAVRKPGTDHPSSAAAHLRNDACQRRHVAAGADGAAGPRPPRDDPALRDVGVPDVAGRVRRRGDPSATPAAARDRRTGSATSQDRLAAVRVPQDPRGARLLLSTPGAEACPYANICEQCDNFVPAPENADVLVGQLADIRALHTDAQTRGWDSEVTRHARVIDKLEHHLATLERTRPNHDAGS